MPFFKRSSGPDNNSKAKLEHKLCLAKDNPEPIFDISDCNLNEVPSGIYSMCRVFRKEVLCLEENNLTSLGGGGSFKDLALLKSFNINSNKLTYIPDEISLLKNLEVLNLGNNKLKKLPSNLSQLTNLKTLNISENKFKEFPEVIIQLPRLQNLDISKCEKLTCLPKDLCQISSSLNTIILDSDNFTYPPSDICREGIEAIMTFLCSECGQEYVPPTNQTEQPLSSPIRDPSRPDCSGELESPVTYHKLQAAKRLRQAALLQWEENYRDNQQCQAQVSADAQARRLKLLEDFSHEQERYQGELEVVQNQKDLDKKKLLTALNSLEDHSAQLIDHLITHAENAKEAIKDAIEKDRLEAEELFLVKQEELDNSRKNEVMAAMKNMLVAEEKQRILGNEKLEISKRLHELPQEDAERIKNIISDRLSDQQTLMSKLLDEEIFQQQAFQALQIKKDQAHNYITYQISLIEQELAQLTSAELKKKDLKVNFEINILAEHRAALAILLGDLLDRKQEREEELRKRVAQLQEQRESEASDFWFIQYQRLMDRKPAQVLDLEDNLDPIVKEVLKLANALHYTSMFAMKRVTKEDILNLTPEFLVKLGITDERSCQKLLEAATQVREDIKLGKRENEQPLLVEPSAPPEEPCQPSAPEFSLDEDFKVWCQNECVVCLDLKSSIVFLPCGHFCCCWPCGEKLESCPMCREAITSRYTNKE